MFIKKSKYQALSRKAVVYENIRNSIKQGEDIEYTEAIKDGIVLMKIPKSITHKVIFDPFYILEQYGINYINKNAVKFEFER